MKRYFWLVLVGAAWAGEASAITVDGTRDVDYGAAIAVQAVDTQFGDANPPTSLGGSELDAAYAVIDGGRLYLLLTGNHEPNFNKLDIFIDSVAGGENTLSGTPQYDYEPRPGFWISEYLGGMVFDAGFTADYHLFSRWGGGTAGYEVDFVNRSGGGSAMVPGSSETSPNAVGLIATGSVPAGDVGPNASGTALTQNLDFAINDNNADGVFGGTGAADQQAAAAVTTGMEFSIALADLGNPSPGSTIRISAMITNGDHNFVSNQFLGSLTPPRGNLASDGNGNWMGDLGDYNTDRKINAADYIMWRKNTLSTAQYETWRTNFGEMPQIDLTNFAGDQFFTVVVPGIGSGSAVPEPASIMLAVTAGLAIFGLTRRK